MIHRKGLASLLVVSVVLAGLVWSWSTGAPRPPRALEPPPGVFPLSAGDAGLPALSSGLNDTFYFGGTRWAPDSSRWEAIPDSVWTFESGVGSHYQHPPGSCKNPAFHELMEGWVGVGSGVLMEARFRRLGTADFAGTPCVGATAGLGGTYSFWAGFTEAEADSACWAAGQGYGDGWDIWIAKDVVYDDAGCLKLSYSYQADLEPGWDYTYVIVDTTGTLPGSEGIVVQTYTGPAAGVASLTLTEGANLRSSAGPIRVKFRVFSDGAYSDEDGDYPTSCGAFAVDDIHVWNTDCGGAIDDLSTFETGTDGWVTETPPCNPDDDWSRLVAASELPWPPDYSGGCDLGDSVLAFYDLATSGHPLYQDEIAVSPWVDLRSAGKTGFPSRFIELGGYYELPLLNYIFVQTLTQWYPDTCLVTGRVMTSPLTQDSTVHYFGGVPTCASTAPRRVNFSAVIPPTAEQVRIAVGVVNYCRYYGNCTGITNSTPWFDNIRFGVATANTIQSFVNAAAPGDTVRIPAGTYTGTGNRDITFNGKEVVLLAPAGPESTFIDCQGAARGFVIDSGEDSTLVIDGFTVRNGKAPAKSDWPYLENGGGVLIAGRARPTLRGCIIETAQAGSGGGIYVADSSGAIVETCTLVGNSASQSGGGLSGNRYADVRIESCTVESNRAQMGGGIYSWSSSVNVFSSTIQDNTALVNGDGEGGGVYGGGLLRGCLIRRNQAGFGGGTRGGHRLEDCEISENVAGEGGGAAVLASASGCQFIGNRATGWGGGGADIPDYATISDCVFAGNKGRIGGGCYVYVSFPFSSTRLHPETVPTRESTRPHGLAPASSELTPWLVGCTFAGNSAELGGAIAMEGRPVIASRCIFWGNCASSSGDQVCNLDSGSQVSFHCCAIDTSGQAFNGPVIYDGPQVFTDPFFCSPASCFATPTTAGDYHLAAGSPCLPESSPCDSLIGALGFGCSTTDVPDDRPPLPLTASLRAFPNPFRADVTFIVGVPANATGSVEIFDVRGRRVRAFDAQDGETALRWDGRSELGMSLPQGIYFVRLRAGAEIRTQRVILIR